MKNPNLLTWLFSLALVAGFFYSMDRHSVKPIIQTIKYDPSVVVAMWKAIKTQSQLLTDLQGFKFPEYDTIATPEDTIQPIIITPKTKLSDLPILRYSRQDSFETAIVGTWVDYQGRLKEVHIDFKPLPMTCTGTSDRTRWLQPYGNLAVSVTWQKCLFSEIECGIEFWNRLAIFGRISADDTLAVMPRVGLRVRF